MEAVQSLGKLLNGRLSGKQVGRGGLAIALGSVALGSVALLTLGYFTPRWVKPATESCAITVYLSRDRLHAGLTLPIYTPVFDWRSHLDLEDLGRVRQQDYAYVSLGWGDRQFYVNTPRFQDLQLTTALRALFWPTDTAMEVRGDRTPPRAGNGYQVKALKLSETGYLRLVDYVLASLEQDLAGQLQPLGRRPTSTFYASRGWYGIWYTCNDWLATGLRAAEVRTPVWSGLAGSVLKQAQSNCIE